MYIRLLIKIFTHKHAHTHNTRTHTHTHAHTRIHTYTLHIPTYTAYNTYKAVTVEKVQHNLHDTAHKKISLG